MKKCRIASISDLKSRSFGKLGVKFLKIPEAWPVSVAHEIIYKDGKDIPWGLHKKTAEFLYILEGKAKVYLDGKSADISAGDYLLIPPGISHRFVTGKKPLVALSLFYPPMNWDNLDAVMRKGAGKKKRNSSGKLKRLPVENR